MKYNVLCLLGIGIFFGCGKEESPAGAGGRKVTDAEMYALANTTAGFVYYKNSSDTLLRSSGSGHTAQPMLRTRYNAKAATQLDGQGKVQSGAAFPDSSLIVKELFNAGNQIEVLAYMFKLNGADNADANGWVWGEVSPGGSVVFSVTNKGVGCFACHSAGIDYTRMNDSHP